MAQSICSVAGCDRQVLARGWCTLHYSRWSRTGTTEESAPYEPAACSAAGCDRKAVARGWCNTHYSRWRLTGTTDDPVKPQSAYCEVNGCDRAATKRRMCDKHYRRLLHTGTTEIEHEYGAPKPPCIVEGCELPGTPRGTGLCYKHYRRQYRHGDVMATSRVVGDDVARFESYLSEGPNGCWNWRGLLTKDGYGVMASDLPTSSAHRWAYRHFVGELINGLEIDHTCNNRRCVNPWHLDQVTHDENLRRMRERAAAQSSPAA